MRNDNEVIAQRLAQWMDSLSQFDLPDWDSLPQLDLYMDQVILLLRRYLTPLDPGGDERSITASIINNYVRMKVIPPPLKKKYSRVHLAYLVIICTLKQSLSISCIQRLLPEEHSEEAARQLYTEFVGQYRRSTGFLRKLPMSNGLPVVGDGKLLTRGGGSLVTTSAILSTLAKALTEHLLGGDEPPYDDDED